MSTESDVGHRRGNLTLTRSTNVRQMVHCVGSKDGWDGEGRVGEGNGKKIAVVTLAFVRKIHVTRVGR